MTIDINDPKLTAYALDELDDAERAGVEAMLANSSDAREAVADIQRTASALTDELTAGSPALLTDAQREVIEQQAVAPASVRTISLWIPFSAAASILLMLTVVVGSRNQSVDRHSANRSLNNMRSVGATGGQYSNDYFEWFPVDEYANAPNASEFAAAFHQSVTSDFNFDGVSDVKLSFGYQLPGAAESLYPSNWRQLSSLREPTSVELEDLTETRFLTVDGHFLEQLGVSLDFVFSGRTTPGVRPSETAEVNGHAIKFDMARAAVERSEIASRLKEAKARHGQQRRAQIEQLFNSAARHRKEQRFGEAAEMLRQIRYLEPSNTKARNQLEVVEDYDAFQREALSAEGSREQLADRIADVKERLEQVRRDQIEMMLESAVRLRDDQRLDEAAQILQQVRYLDPENDEAQNQLFIVEGLASEQYASIHDNPFLPAWDKPLSTFSIDVDTASYSNIRRFINESRLPPADAVRIEEMINYFTYDYPQPTGDDPFGVSVEIADCPWTPEHRLVRVGLQGMTIERDERPASNLVFLLDVSGSMNSPAKLPLLKQSLALLIEELDGYDRVAMVVYAGNSGLVLPSTTADNTETILNALQNLSAGGSTNGGAGIQLAYDIATENFIDGGVNRVILATDGDFNVGITDQDELTRLIEDKAKTGVFLSVLGFGTGNLKDATMEKLADNGNGNYAYIDSLDEGRKVLVDQMGGTLITIAKDVKIQIEFNPAEVSAYRLIGYENRKLAARDFNDDTKDAGEIGAGHMVTALYEVVPSEFEFDFADFESDEDDVEALEQDDPELRSVDPLRYQWRSDLLEAADSGELLTLKLRYKQPDGDVSKLMEYAVTDRGASLAESSQDFRFASAVASFGMLLRHSAHAGGWTLEAVAELAAESIGDDPDGYRLQFLDLVRRAAELRGE